MASSSTGKGKGRQKIKMEKMQNESNLQVTFSKRRHGVLKKAYELSILTGAEVAAIVFSPGGKVYTFGHPSTEAVTERFLTGTSQPLTLIQQRAQARRNRNVAGINVEIAKAKEMLEFEKSRGESLNKALSEGQGQGWNGLNLDEQNLSQLQHSKLALNNVQAEFEREFNRRAAAKQSCMMPAGIYSYYGVEGAFAPLFGPTYDGNGSGIGMHPIAYADNKNGSGGDFLPLMMGPVGYGGGGNGVGLYGNSGAIVGEPFFGGPSSLTGEGGGGLPHIYGICSSVVGNGVGGWSFGDGPSPFGGGGPFVSGSSSFVGGGSGDGLPNANGASSSGAGNSGGGSTTKALEWNGLMPPSGFGGGF